MKLRDYSLIMSLYQSNQFAIILDCLLTRKKLARFFIYRQRFFLMPRGDASQSRKNCYPFAGSAVSWLLQRVTIPMRNEPGNPSGGLPSRARDRNSTRPPCVERCRHTCSLWPWYLRRSPRGDAPWPRTWRPVRWDRATRPRCEERSSLKHSVLTQGSLTSRSVSSISFLFKLTVVIALRQVEHGTSLDRLQCQQLRQDLSVGIATCRDRVYQRVALEWRKRTVIRKLLRHCASKLSSTSARPRSLRLFLFQRDRHAIIQQLYSN